MTMPTVPVLYLVAAIVGVLFTINGFRPAHRPSLFTVPSFFAGWPQYPQKLSSGRTCQILQDEHSSI